jgi:hypothetical protein
MTICIVRSPLNHIPDAPAISEPEAIAEGGEPEPAVVMESGEPEPAVITESGEHNFTGSS